MPSPPSVSWTLATDTVPLASESPAETVEPVDIQLGTDGDIDLSQGLLFTSGIGAVTQGLRIRLQTFRGEWFLNLDEGVPYFQDLLGQKFVETRARSAFRTAIMATPGVVEIIHLVVDFDRGLRTLSIDFKVRGDAGVISESLEVTV